MTHNENELLVLSDYGSNEVMRTNKVTVEKIHETLDSINWNLFHIVTLSRSEFEWIEVGGNLKEAGLGCVYHENNELFHIDTGPTTIEQIKKILTSYFKEDNEFKIINKFTGEEEERKKKKEEDAIKFKKWKKGFLVQQKREKIAYAKKIIIAILIIISFSFISYYWYIGELQFIGQETETTSAKIVNTQMHHIGNGYYMQTVTYEFKFNNITYSGTFEAGKRIGRQKIGNYVKVKFSKINPKRSSKVTIYKKN